MLFLGSTVKCCLSYSIIWHKIITYTYSYSVANAAHKSLYKTRKKDHISEELGNEKKYRTRRNCMTLQIKVTPD